MGPPTPSGSLRPSLPEPTTFPIHLGMVLSRPAFLAGISLRRLVPPSLLCPRLVRRTFQVRSAACKDCDPPGKSSAEKRQRELIISVLEAQPSARDSRFYLQSFAPKPKPGGVDAHPGRLADRQDLSGAHGGSADELCASNVASFPTTESMPTTATLAASADGLGLRADVAGAHPSVSLGSSVSLGDPIVSAPHQHTGLVKIQGPFTDRQLESIVDGMIYLRKLGLMAVIVLDDEEWNSARMGQRRSKPRGLFALHRQESLRHCILRETARLSAMLEQRGGETRPMVEGVLRLGDGRCDDGHSGTLDLWLDHLPGLRSAIEQREFVIVPPLAINSSCTAVCVSADEAVIALAKGLAQAGQSPLVRPARSAPLDEKPTGQALAQALHTHPARRRGAGVDLTPLRLMVINREGGIPSPARNGHPHLSINLASEHDFIHDTFRWHASHPTSLSNLSMAAACLEHLPNESSALIVSHRSPKSLVANLITNKPAHSPSLSHAVLLNYHRAVGPATPSLIRKGLPIRVIRGLPGVHRAKLTALLEASFGKRLDAAAFYGRLERCLKFVIVAGDYQGAAVVTEERDEHGPTPEAPITYLDKFGVLPCVQGQGIVDFLWGALRDETFGLGCPDALNNNGGLGGVGDGVDLVWRSRTDNPVNRWYWERSNGSLHMGRPEGATGGPAFTLFWCYAVRGGVEAPEPALRGEARVDPGPLSGWVRAVRRIRSGWASGGPGAKQGGATQRDIHVPLSRAE